MKFKISITIEGDPGPSSVTEYDTNKNNNHKPVPEWILRAVSASDGELPGWRPVVSQMTFKLGSYIYLFERI